MSDFAVVRDAVAAADFEGTRPQMNMTPRERLARLADEWLRFHQLDDPAGGDIDALLAVVAETVAIFPVMACEACGKQFVRSDRRRTLWCSDRCRYRIGKREQRRRAKETEMEHDERIRAEERLRAGQWMGSSLMKDWTIDAVPDRHE